MRTADLDPKDVRAAQILVNRDLCILTGAELQSRYGGDRDHRVFRQITGQALEALEEHNPFWHYNLNTWYKRPFYRKLLHPPRHRDEICRAIVDLAQGEHEEYEGDHYQYPRRGLKSFHLKMALDWLPKRHKIVDDLDLLMLYSHNREDRARGASNSVKHMNRTNRFVIDHFGPDCRTFSGAPANFQVPPGEWGSSKAWDWPCRAEDFLADQTNVQAEAALSKKAGGGYNYKLIDDWEAEDSKESEVVRRTTQDHYDQLRQLNAPPWSREICVGTPYHVQSLYKPMLEGKDEETGKPTYFVIKVPALDEENRENFPTIPRLQKRALARERAREINARGTDRFWHLQYMLDAISTGEQALQWEFFQPLSPEQLQARFGTFQKFRAVYCDPAWKGDDNHQEGSDAVIATVDLYSIAGMMTSILLDLWVSNDAESDVGADEMLRQMRVWHTHYYSIESQADKPFVGLMKRLWRGEPFENRVTRQPHFIDVKSWNKKTKNDRISTLAGHAKTGHWYYLDTIPRMYLDVLKVTANEHPAAVKRDTLDCLAQTNADEILEHWVPVSVPHMVKEEEEDDLGDLYATRYTGLPMVAH